MVEFIDGPLLDENTDESGVRHASMPDTDYSDANAESPGYSLEHIPLTRGLVGWWPLAWDTPVDLSGNGNHGTPNGGPTTGVAGRGGLQATSFDGADDEVNMGDVLPFSDSDPFSYTAWVNVGAFNSSETGNVVGNRGRRRNLAVEAGGTIRLLGYDGSNQDFSTSKAISEGEWAFLSATFDGGTARIYINATEEASSPFAYTEGGYNDIINTASGAGRIRPLDATIVGVRVYSRALSDAEIQTLYEWGSADLARPPTDGVARYPLDGDATDAWGSNDGTATGVAYVNDSIRGQAGQFEAANSDRVATKNFTELESEAFTIATWAKVNDQTRFNGVVVQRLNNQGVYLGTDGDSPDAYFGVHDGSGTGHQLKTSGDWPAGEWVFVVGVKSSSGMRLYMNGELVNSNSDSFTPLSTGEVTYIGGNHQNGGGYTDGLIDDVRIYDYALTPAEVQALYRWGTRGIDMSKLTVKA